jgi:outer membrane lipoprotein-sorting protein
MLLADYRVKEYVQEERSGSRVRMEILEWEPNAEVPAEAFTLEVPEGTKVVRVGGQA